MIKGRAGEIVTRESKDWLGRAMLDWARRLAESKGFAALREPFQKEHQGRQAHF